MKLGRKPPKNAPSLKLASFLTGVVPDHPAMADYLARLKNWQMLGNDQYGDCVAVTWANIRRLVTAALSPQEKYPNIDQVLTLYKTQNPNFPLEDNGMDIQSCLEYLVKFGGPDGVKALGFAQVDITNLEEVKAAIGIFGCIWTGVYVLSNNMDQFNSGKPWDYSMFSSREGGHSIISGGYNFARPGALAGDVDIITWAQETSLTDSFWKHEAEEAWVVIWPEHLGSKAFMEGIDLNTFAADYKAITGKDFPVSINPAPAPPPVAEVTIPVMATTAGTLKIKNSADIKKVSGGNLALVFQQP